MAHYKFTYFNAKGLGEVSRQIFILAGQKFEDNRIELEDWPRIKDETPFGQLPVLEVDGKQLAQSMAIARYLARTFGYAGKTDWESAQIDAFADQFMDFHKEIRPFLWAAYGIAPGDLDKMKTELLDPAIQKHFEYFENAIKDWTNGFLVGDSVSYADLLIAEYVAIFVDEGFHSLENFPKLISLAKIVHSIPVLAQWRKNRPKTQI